MRAASQFYAVAYFTAYFFIRMVQVGACPLNNRLRVFLTHFFYGTYYCIANRMVFVEQADIKEMPYDFEIMFADFSSGINSCLPGFGVIVQ